MVIIIGAGISGLSAARMLKKEFIILEKTGQYGGLSAQYHTNGHWFDYGGHYFHFKNNLSIKSYLEQYGRFQAFNRKSKTFLLNTYIPFPLQYHLSYLPRPIARKILSEIPDQPESRMDNLHDFLKTNLGEQLFSIFFQPFLKKYFQKNLKEIMAHMDKGSIPIPDRKTMVEGFKGKRFLHQGYNPRFYYPVIPLRHFIDNLAAKIRPAIKLNQTVKEINVRNKRITTSGTHYNYNFIINTMPLKHLLEIIRPSSALPDYGNLEHISTLVANVVLKKRKKRFHWVYLPEGDFPFYRAGYYPLRNPPVCYLEKSLIPSQTAPGTPLIKEEITFTLKRLRMIERPEDILYMDHRIIPVSHVIFNHQWKKIVPPVLEKLEALGIFSIGRYGAWNYTSMSDDVQQAIETAAIINET